MPTSQARFACRARTIFLPATANGASRPKATEERNVHYQLVDLSNNAVPTSQIALVNFIQLEGKATSCGRDTCVRRWYQSDGAAYEDCQVSSSASPAERNRLLNFKTSCLTRIGGRKNVSELLPIFDEK